MSSSLAVLRRLRPPADADALALYVHTRDPLLLADLVRRHGGLVWGVCRRAVPHRPDAEDAYQATWLVLAANPGAVRSPAALPAFLHTVAVRTCRRVRRKRPLTASGDHLPARESVAADREQLAALDDELAKLPDTLRRPLVLCYLDGATQDEAAKSLGLSLSTLKRRLETGKELLRLRLAGRGVDLAAVLATAGLTGVGAPAVVAGGAGVVATALSTEVLTAMWILKAKGWAAGLVLAAGLTATGGGLMLADDPAKPGTGPGKGVVPGGGAEVVTRPATELAELKDENFEVHAPTAAEATQLHRAASAARHALAVRWLGKELPPWKVPCVITYKPSPGGTDGGGATHFTFAAAGPTSMRMELFGSLPKVLADVLPHEVMHTILATHFGKALPRWADEGIAVLAEPDGSHSDHARRAAELLNQGRGLPLRGLFPMTEYPMDMQVLFAQGYSVCRFLLDRKPGGGAEAALLDFVRRGMADGWEPAATAVYGFADLDAMQADWITSLRVPAPLVANPPVAPPPVSDAVRAAYEEQMRELTRAIAAANEAVDAQQKVADRYEKLPGVSETEKLNNLALVARYRENAIQARVELAKVKVEIAKLGPAPALPPATVAPVVPPRLLKERIDTARRFVDLDRQIRAAGTVPKEESAAFEMNLTHSARQLYEAVRAADPTPAGQLAAAREWYVATRDGELFFAARVEQGLNRTQVALAATLSRNESETALLQAMAAAPPAARDGIAPFAAAPAGYSGKVVRVESGRAVLEAAAGLRPQTALRLVRGGRPVGLLVVVGVDATAARVYGVPLPNPDGTVPTLQVGDDVRP